MLSKYFDYTTNDVIKADAEAVSALISNMKSVIHVDGFRQIKPGGTLGLFFTGEVGGKKRFFKTHQPNDLSKENLLKEMYLMEHLYKNSLEIESIEFEINNQKQAVMAMSFLNLSNSMYLIEDVQSLIETYKGELVRLDCGKINYTLENFEKAVIKSYEELARAGLIDFEIYSYSKRAVKNFEVYKDYERCICHGDLSNVNIVPVNGELVAIDWEDALVNVPEYDLLYWLTFFSQRKYYTSSLFVDLKIDETYGKDLMVMILLVKSYMSYRSGSYVNNSLSIRDRLNEIIHM